MNLKLYGVGITYEMIRSSRPMFIDKMMSHKLQLSCYRVMYHCAALELLGIGR